MEEGMHYKHLLSVTNASDIRSAFGPGLAQATLLFKDWRSGARRGKREDYLSEFDGSKLKEAALKRWGDFVNG
jgi:hypothetical protein